MLQLTYTQGLLLAVFLATSTAGFCHFVCTPNIGLQIMSFMLAQIASVYGGFAVMDGGLKVNFVEWHVMLAFLGLAIYGWNYGAIWIALGYFLHGVWDVLHPHADDAKKSDKLDVETRFLARVVPWYPPFCLLYDWLIAVFIYFEYC